MGIGKIIYSLTHFYAYIMLTYILFQSLFTYVMSSESIPTESLGQLYDAAKILYHQIENTSLDSNSEQLQVRHGPSFHSRALFVWV